MALNHRRLCFHRRRSTIMEQSSSRSAPILDIYYFQIIPEVTSVQLILSFSLTVSLTIFVQSPCSCLCKHNHLQAQGRKGDMWQQPWHFFTVSGWQSLGWCDAASASYTRSRHCNAGVTVWFPEIGRAHV